MPDGPMDDESVRQHVRRVEEDLEALERLPAGPRETALDAVRDLVTLYGEGWRRALERLDDAGAGGAGVLAEDELIGHLLRVHDLHPEGAEDRIREALERIRPYLRSRGRDVSLVAVDDGIARIRVQDGGASPAGDGRAGAVDDTVEAAVLGAAPELDRVETVRSGSGDGRLVQLRMGRPSGGDPSGDGPSRPDAEAP